MLKGSLQAIETSLSALKILLLLSALNIPLEIVPSMLMVCEIFINSCLLWIIHHHVGTQGQSVGASDRVAGNKDFVVGSQDPTAAVGSQYPPGDRTQYVQGI